MKYFIYLFIITGFFLFASTGCKKFLDIVPDERPSEEDAFRDPLRAKNYLYSCYGYLPSSRFTPESIDMLTSDETITAFEHETFARFPRGQYSASDPVISYWSDLYKGIHQCYILLKKVDGVPGINADEAANYKAEANFLIGYYHFLLVRMYGPVIIVDHELDPNMPIADYPKRSPYDLCVDFIVSKMDEAANQLPSRHGSTIDYGRATSIAALSIKARMLLYAASPLFNGGGGLKPGLYTDFKDKQGVQLISAAYDKNKWKLAADAAKKAIDAAEADGMGLYMNSTMTTKLPSNPVERDLRYTFVDRNSREIIWADTRNESNFDLQNKSTPYLTGSSGEAYNGVAPTIWMLEQFYTKNGLPIDKDPDFDYAGRYQAANGLYGRTLSLNLNREPRFNAWIAYHNSYYEVTRNNKDSILVQFRRNDPHGIQGRSNNYSPTGYLNKKGVYPKLDQSRLQVSYQYPWPVIRLAELYLDYAEALIEYGDDLGTAKHYIDLVRARAGIPSIDAAWGRIGGANSQDVLRRIVRQERTIELYLENHRFWDARRWMEAENFNNKAKGMNIQGASDAEFFNIVEVSFPRSFTSRNYLMPIIQSEINKNEKLVQNPGY